MDHSQWVKKEVKKEKEKQLGMQQTGVKQPSSHYPTGPRVDTA
jgi:hypothetical protein